MAPVGSQGAFRDRCDRVNWISGNHRRPVYCDSVDVLDSYSGHTDPGGPAARRELDALSITKVSVGPMDNNAYLLVCRATNEALLVDAANEPERLADLVGSGDQRPELRHIVTTHRHFDHWQALGAVAGMFQTRRSPTRSTRPSCRCRPTSWSRTATPCASARSSWRSCTCAATRPARWRCVYRDTKGPAHLHRRLAVPRRPGQDQLARSFTSLINDLEERVFGTLPDETWVYPGHGDDTTLGKERPSLPEWRTRGW